MVVAWVLKFEPDCGMIKVKYVHNGLLQVIGGTRMMGVVAGLLLADLIFSPVLASGKDSTETTVWVANDLDMARSGQIVELSWPEIAKRNPALKADRVAVLDDAGEKLGSQALDEDGDGLFERLLVKVDFAEKESRKFRIISGSAEIPAAGSLVNAMFYPKRADDFSWENDRIAFRMYGPALMRSAGPASGVDVWCKHVPELVALKMYQPGNNYHGDNGLGLDGYNVMGSRGCGGTGILNDGKLYVSGNFSAWKVLANGPLRAVFELTYAAWDAGGTLVHETKRISLDAGSQLNRMESRFYFQGATLLTATVGVVIHKTGKATVNQPDGWATVWEPLEGKGNGMLGVALVTALTANVEYRQMKDRSLDHVLATIPVKSGEPVVYYAGAGWSKHGFGDVVAWQAYVADFARKLKSPLRSEW